MGTLYLVRHGQASFGAADYDQLSPLGHRQSVRLGEYFRERGITFDAVLTGTLRRQRQTWEGIAEGLGLTAEPLPWAGLNEYDSAALLATLQPPPALPTDAQERYRMHFRMLREALAAWMEGRSQPVGMPGYTEFLAGITSALDHVRASHHGARVLAVSSGGPIANAVGHVLGAAPQAVIDLNLRIRNTAVTEFVFTPKRHMLMTFNALPHLQGLDESEWVTST